MDGSLKVAWIEKLPNVVTGMVAGHRQTLRECNCRDRADITGHVQVWPVVLETRHGAKLHTTHMNIGPVCGVENEP